MSGMYDGVEQEHLTNVQAELLAAIRQRAERGEPAPSYRDLCAEFGWASTGTARDHLQALARKGYITLGGGRARQLRLVDGPSEVTRVPVLGLVVAGIPDPAEASPEGDLAVPKSWLGRGQFFALRVRGDSMKDAAIIDGDTVVVREQETALHGDIVVATVNCETTVKRLSVRGRSVRLVPENPQYSPIDLHDKDVTIHGVVVAVMRQLAASASGTPARSRTGRVRHMRTRNG